MFAHVNDDDSTVDDRNDQMNYKAVLEQFGNEEVPRAVMNALDLLFAQDMKLLQKDVAERTIASQLARHLHPFLSGLDIDVEYNAMGDDPKRVTWKANAPTLVYPDIIVHHRGTNTNVLVIEIKKDSSGKGKDDDIRKLRAYRRELGYRYALFLRFATGGAAGTVLECEWVDA